MALTTGICKLCLQQKPLLNRSHIIPEFMYEEANLYDEHHQFRKLKLEEIFDAKAKIQRVSKGIYEAGILCQTCDGLVIKKYEDYGKYVLFSEEHEAVNGMKYQNVINPTDGFKSMVCSNIDYRKFKLFLLSMLWRASISSRIEFENVSLGTTHNEILRNMIFNGEPKKENDYPIIVSSWLRENPTMTDIFISPRRLKKGSNTYYQFCIGGFVFIYSISKELSNEEIFKCSIKPDSTMTIPFFSKGTEEKFLINFLFHS